MSGWASGGGAGGGQPCAGHQRWVASPLSWRTSNRGKWRGTRGGGGGGGGDGSRRSSTRVRRGGVVTPRSDLDVVETVVDALPGTTLGDFLRQPDTFTAVHTSRIQTFSGLEIWDAQLGFHFNVPAVIAATGVLLPVSGILLFSTLWERVWKESVFGSEEPEKEPVVLCGIDCSAYPIFSNPRVTRAAAFAERWHHGQYRRSGEPYVTHCVEAARILATLLPPSAESRKYVDAIVACLLHDVVDDTECELDDVREVFGDRVAKLVSDVSTLGKLPQILRRYQRRGVNADVDAAAEDAPPPSEDVGRMEVEELVTMRKLLLVMVDDPRVFLIKIADRLHNMRTLYAVNPVKGKFVANETLQVWCSFAEQLGLFEAKAEMEDLSFAVVDPQAFRDVIDARVNEWVANKVVSSSPGVHEKKDKKKEDAEEEEEEERDRERRDSAAQKDEAVMDEIVVAAPPLRFKSAWTWEPPTGADLQMFVEKVLRGENAGTPRKGDKRHEQRSAEEAARRVRAEAAATVREEERLKRAKPLSPEQEELRAMLACVPPFDLMQASKRNSKSPPPPPPAAAAAAAAAAATAAVAAGDSAALDEDVRSMVGSASLESSLLALRSCRDATLRSLQLDSLAPGLRVEITGRLKSAYSTHLKMRRKNITFGQVCDARALRIVVGEAGPTPGTRDEVEACFRFVETIHKLYRPTPGEYDDYITNKKKSGYQSLHTAVVGPDGALLEFQVRTRAMHEAAEFGNAAHWLYKDLTNVAAAAAAAGTTTPSPSSSSSSVEAPSFEAAEVGQPVQIVNDREHGGGFSAGVVVWSRGTRVHVVEPNRGDTYAPGLSSSSSGGGGGGDGAGNTHGVSRSRLGLLDTAEWVAMGLHTALFDRATKAGRVAPGQSGPGYLVVEFALCSDGRWHKVDSYGRKLAVTAELLDEEALLEALERAEEEAVAAATAAVLAAEEKKEEEEKKKDEVASEEANNAEEQKTEAAKANKAKANVKAAVMAEADEVVAAFEARLSQAAAAAEAAAAAAGEDASADGGQRGAAAVERGSFFDIATFPSSGASTVDRGEGDNGITGTVTGAEAEVDVVIQGVASRADDATVDSRVRAMQSSLQAYLKDSYDEDEDGDEEDGPDVDVQRMMEEESEAAAAVTPVNKATTRSSPAAVEHSGAAVAAKEEAKTSKTERGNKGLWWGLIAAGQTKSDASSSSSSVKPITVEQALEQAREELRLASARAAEEAAAERRRMRRAKQEVAWRSGEAESPLFSIVQAEVAPGINDDKPLGILDPDEAKKLEATIGLKLKSKKMAKEASKASSDGKGGRPVE